MPQVTSPEHLKNAQRFKQLWTRYQQSRDLISVGAYVPGGDPDTDLAIERFPVMSDFLRQDLNESEDLAASIERLANIVAAPQQSKADTATTLWACGLVGLWVIQEHI